MEQKNLDIYGHPPIPWSRALKQLGAVTEFTEPGENSAKSHWLATTRPGGRPHLTAVGALWVDGMFYFTSGSGSRKSRNLAENPDCVISMSLPDLDLVVEGRVAIVTDEATLRHLAERYAAQGWPVSVSGDAFTAEFSAPSAGPPPWALYEFAPATAFGVATAEPWGATRWRFDK